MENREVWASPGHFWKRLGQQEEAGLLPLEFQVCGLSNVSEEFLQKKEKMWKKSRESQWGRFKLNQSLGKKESHRGKGRGDEGSLAG